MSVPKTGDMIEIVGSQLKYKVLKTNGLYMDITVPFSGRTYCGILSRDKNIRVISTNPNWHPLTKIFV